MYKLQKIGYPIDISKYISETGDFMYRKFGLIAVTLVIIAVMTCSASWGELSGNQVHAVAGSAPTDLQPKYRVCAAEGYIAVYTYPQNTLYCKTDIPLRSLRQKDQEKITSGLYLYTPEALTTFLEDFGS